MNLYSDRSDECYAVWVCQCGCHRVWRRHTYCDLMDVADDVECYGCGRLGNWSACHTTRGWVHRPKHLPNGMDDYR